MSKLSDFYSRHSNGIKTALTFLWALLCAGFMAFISVIIYLTEDSVEALVIGFSISALILLFGIVLTVRRKSSVQELYSPGIPLEYNHPRTVKKIKEAYAAHRAEVDPKQLLELELAPNILTTGSDRHLARLNAQIAEQCKKYGVDKAAFDLDYFNGEIFRGSYCMLNVGEMFTVYCDLQANQFAFRNSEIIYVGPYVHTEDVGPETGQVFYIKLRIESEEIYHVLKIAPYMDRPVLDAFTKRKSSLHPDCEIYKYPQI